MPVLLCTNRRSCLAVALLSMALVCQIEAQSPKPAAVAIADSARREIDAANATGDAQRMLRTVTLLERATVAYPGDAWLTHYLGFAHYRASNLARGQQDQKALEMHLDEAEKALMRSIAARPIAESHALLSAVLGQKIAEGNPLTAMRLGPRADRELDKALELGLRNPRVWAIRASSVLYKPKMFGGSVVKAEEYARKAIELSTGDSVSIPAPRWGLTDAYTFLGQALVAQKKYADAQAAYERVLALEPANGHVTYVLMPALRKAIEKRVP
jgi:tetratricopeptide (TPR) repeat protein